MSNKLCQKSAYVNTLPSNTVHVGKVHKERNCTEYQCAELGSLNNPCLNLKQAIEVVNKKKLTNVLVQIAAGDYTDTDKDLEIPSAIRKIEGGGREVTKLGSGLRASSSLSIDKMTIGTDLNTAAFEFYPISLGTRGGCGQSPSPIEDCIALLDQCYITGYINGFDLDTGRVGKDTVVQPPETDITLSNIIQNIGAKVSNIFHGKIRLTIKKTRFVKRRLDQEAREPGFDISPFISLQGDVSVDSSSNNFEVLDSSSNSFEVPVIEGVKSQDDSWVAYAGSVPFSFSDKDSNYTNTVLADFKDDGFPDIKDSPTPLSNVQLKDVSFIMPMASNSPSLLTVVSPVLAMSVDGLKSNTSGVLFVLGGGNISSSLTSINAPKSKLFEANALPIDEGLQAPPPSISVLGANVGAVGNVVGYDVVIQNADIGTPSSNQTTPDSVRTFTADNVFDNCQVRFNSCRFKNSPRLFKDCREVIESFVNLTNSDTSSCLEQLLEQKRVLKHDFSLVKSVNSFIDVDDGVEMSFSTCELINDIEKIPIIVKRSNSHKSALISVINSKINHKGSTFLKFLEGVKEAKAYFGTSNITSQAQSLAENNEKNQKGTLKYGGLALNSEKTIEGLKPEEQSDQITQRDMGY